MCETLAIALSYCFCLSVLYLLYLEFIDAYLKLLALKSEKKVLTVSTNTLSETFVRGIHALQWGKQYILNMCQSFYLVMQQYTSFH